MNSKDDTNKKKLVFDVDVTYDPALDEYAKTRQPSAKLIKLNEDMKKPYWQKFLKQLHEEIESKK